MPWRGGEDFELLLTVPRSRVERLIKMAGKKQFKVSRIGRVLPLSSGVRLVDEKGRSRPLTARGYEHFR